MINSVFFDSTLWIAKRNCLFIYAYSSSEKCDSSTRLRMHEYLITQYIFMQSRSIPVIARLIIMQIFFRNFRLHAVYMQVIFTYNELVARSVATLVSDLFVNKLLFIISTVFCFLSSNCLILKSEIGFRSRLNVIMTVDCISLNFNQKKLHNKLT